MICFLTNRHDLDGTDHLRLNPSNQFVDRLRQHFPTPCRAIYVCSDPDGWDTMDRYAACVRAAFENEGFRFERFLTLDSRNEAQAAELVRSTNLLILAGGHVPTQNRFFRKIGLRELLSDFDGVLIGISAGSMNCAEVVYAHPDLEGEAVDPNYQKDLPGLGLTRTRILPHYQEIKDDVLDGLRVMEDVAYPDSKERPICVLPDGSYVYIEDGKESVMGEAWLLSNGVLTPYPKG